MTRGEDAAARPRPRCPTCRKPVSWSGNPSRPFCSWTCKVIDLGGWLDEAYRIPGSEPPAGTPGGGEKK